MEGLIDQTTCAACRFIYPDRFLPAMFIHGAYYPVCPICANQIMGGLIGELSVQLYEDFNDWLHTDEGRRYRKLNQWEPCKIWEIETNDIGGIVKLITPLARFCYVNAFKPAPTPSGDEKFSACIMIPKEDTQGLDAINKAIQAAIAKGIEKNTFNKIAVKTLRLPLRDGDAEFEEGSRGPEFKGFFFMNANSNRKPGVVDSNLQPIMDEDDFYSGCWGHADINFFPYNTKGNKGIGVGLNNMMKKKDDERLDGRMAAEDAFAAYAEKTEGDDTPSDQGDLL